MVAFHFHLANQAGWKCDVCRAAGLEKKRRCGFIKDPQDIRGDGVVWARKGVALQTCPRSYISAQSEGWLEAFFAFRQFGGVGVSELGARDAEAFLILEQELAKERSDGQANTGSHSQKFSRR